MSDVELLVAQKPNIESTLRYLVRLSIAGGPIVSTKGTWPRTAALY